MEGGESSRLTRTGDYCVTGSSPLKPITGWMESHACSFPKLSMNAILVCHGVALHP